MLHIIEAEYDPNSTEAIGGRLYQAGGAAIVYDKWYNPVEDSTYVYWSISPLPPDTLIDAFVEGVSYTNNEGILSGTATSGVARSNIVYSTDAIGDIGQVRALTFGANGILLHLLLMKTRETLHYFPYPVKFRCLQMLHIGF